MAITQSRELLGIAEEKLNPKAQFIELVNLLGVLLDIGTEEQAGTNSIGKATVNQVDDSNLPFQRDVPESGSVKVNLGVHGFHKGEAGQVLEVNFAVVLARSASSLLHPDRACCDWLSRQHGQFGFCLDSHDRGLGGRSSRARNHSDTAGAVDDRDERARSLAGSPCSICTSVTMRAILSLSSCTERLFLARLLPQSHLSDRAGFLVKGKL